MQFDFGKNWTAFARKALTQESIEQARTDFARLMQGIPLPGASLLDIGFGQGLSLLIAREAGACAVGNDINPKCGEALALTARLFPAVRPEEIPVVIGSILDESVRSALTATASGTGQFDIVHSWGVLHHTGRMYEALAHAAQMVRPGGHLILAIYNRHWTSPLWRLIKRTYVSLPRPLQQLLVLALYPVIAGAKWAVTRRNPFSAERGMDFFYNVIDWVGGYPYEYASRAEIQDFIERLGFTCTAFYPAAVPTGCNEFIFNRRLCYVTTSKD